MENFRTAVFICSCDGKIACNPDCQKLAGQAAALPGVVTSLAVTDLCKESGLGLITELLRQQDIQRIVVIACTPCTCETTLRNHINEISTGQTALHLSRIRQNWPWVHEESQKATQKIWPWVNQQIAESALQSPLANSQAGLKAGVLIVGAGCCQGPMDSQDSLAQASAAALRALTLLNNQPVEKAASSNSQVFTSNPTRSTRETYLIYIGIDDTDILDGPGTGRVAKALAQCLEEQGLGKSLGVSRHQLLIDSRVRSTSHNSSKGLAMLTNHPEVDFYQPAITFMQNCFVEGSDPGLCFCPEDKMNQAIIDYAKSAKKILLTKEEAVNLAAKYHLFLRELGGDGGGVIGALASVGLRAAGDDGRVIDLKGIKEIKGIVSAGEVLARTDIVRVQDMHGNLLRNEELIDSRDWLRPSLVGGQPVLRVKPGLDKEGQPIWIPVELKFKDMLKEKNEY